MVVGVGREPPARPTISPPRRNTTPAVAWDPTYYPDGLTLAAPATVGLFPSRPCLFSSC